MQLKTGTLLALYFTMLGTAYIVQQLPNIYFEVQPPTPQVRIFFVYS